MSPTTTPTKDPDMPLHPDAAAFLERRRQAGTRFDHELSIAEARAEADLPTPLEQREPVANVHDGQVPGPGGDIPIRVYEPASPAGVVVYLHGGGHITGTLDSYDGLCRRLANRVPATIVSVGYRRAPEHRVPADIDDAEAVYHWTLAHLDDLASSRRRRVAIAGDSAGGHITAAVTRRLRDSHQPLPALQVLLYPALDAVAYRNRAYPSHTECGDGYGMVYADGLHYLNQHLGPDGDPATPDASPLRAPDLTGLPPAYILTAEYDVLRDEGHAYAERLTEAGVPANYRMWPGQIHGFLGDPAGFTQAEPALKDVAAALYGALAHPGEPFGAAPGLVDTGG